MKETTFLRWATYVCLPLTLVMFVYFNGLPGESSKNVQFRKDVTHFTAEARTWSKFILMQPVPVIASWKLDAVREAYARIVFDDRADHADLAATAATINEVCDIVKSAFDLISNCEMRIGMYEKTRGLTSDQQSDLDEARRELPAAQRALKQGCATIQELADKLDTALNR